MNTTRLVLTLLVAATLVACSTETAEETREEPTMNPGTGRAVATFGGGCFWCVEAVFLRVDGVLTVRSGYAGGDTESPTYQAVTSGDTGHAEVVQIEYDPAKVPYAVLLEIFFKTHDPTTLNRQGADVGTQYRSLILVHDEEQKALAEKAKRELDAAGIFDGPIVTQIEPYTTFWPAEGYHQDYYAKNPTQPYCQAVVRPKVEKLEKLFRERLK
jgi:peptide-methionine (S)-S-oxide reductase